MDKLQAEIAAVAAAAQRLCSVPVELGVHIIAVAEAVTQLRTAILHAGVVIGTLRHVDAPHAAGGLDIRGGKARRRAEELRRLAGEDGRYDAVQARDLHQLEKRPLLPPCLLLHIAVDRLQGLLLWHHPLQRLIGRDARQDLVFQMALLLLACVVILRPQRLQPRVKGGVQRPGLRRRP